MGKKGSEGGIALRNTIVKLQAPTTDAIKQLKAAGVNIKTMQNQSLSLTDRLRALTPVMHNATIMSALFGSENLASAMALIEGVDQIDTWTEAIRVLLLRSTWQINKWILMPKSRNVCKRLSTT